MNGTVVEGVIGRVKGRYLVVDKRTLSMRCADARDSFVRRVPSAAGDARAIFVIMEFSTCCCSREF
jgi:hypothetical protein